MEGEAEHVRSGRPQLTTPEAECSWRFSERTIPESLVLASGRPPTASGVVSWAFYSDSRFPLTFCSNLPVGVLTFLCDGRRDRTCVHCGGDWPKAVQPARLLPQ